MGIHNADVHFILGASDGTLGFIAFVLQGGANGLCDSGFCAVYPVKGLLIHIQPSALGVFQEGLEGSYPFRAAAGQVDLLRGQGGKDFHLVPRPGNRHVQSPPPSGPVQGAEVHGDLSVLVSSVAYGKQNHVPLVSLDIFQVFDKYRFFGSVGPLFQLLVQAAGLCQEIVDQVLLADVEGDHTHAVPGQLRVMAAAL